MNQTLSIRECLRFGWRTFKTRPWYFVGVTLLLMVLNALAPNADPHDPWQMSLILFVISMLIGFLLNLFTTAFTLKAHDAPESVRLRDAWRPELYLRFVGTMLLSIAIILVGFVLLIVPGVIAGVGLMFVNYFVVDKGLGPVESIKASWELTKGYRWKLFLFLLTIILVNVLGLLAVIVGLLVSVPVSIFASIHAYRLLNEYKNPAPPAPVADV